jgi:hypothetical protein
MIVNGMNNGAAFAVCLKDTLDISIASLFTGNMT